MFEAIKEISIRCIRRKADKTNRSCLSASLAEAAVRLDKKNWVNLSVLSSEMGVGKEGTVPPEVIFEQTRRGLDFLGLTPEEVLVNPSFLEHTDDISNYFPKFRGATGEVRVSHPHVRLLANEHEPKKFALHAEFYDGSSRVEKRLEDLNSRGWFVAAVITLKES